MKKLHKLIYLSMLFLNACGPLPDSQEKHVIGTENRVMVNIAKSPWRHLGRIRVFFKDGSFGHCTGALVKPNVVLTAAHCMYKDGVSAHSSVFMAQYADGNFAAKANVIDSLSGTSDIIAHPSADWALLKIDKNLGSTYGYMGMWGIPAESFKYPFIVDLGGYSKDIAGGERMSAHAGCKLLRTGTNIGTKGTIQTDCDMDTGASGGPLIAYHKGLPYVAAIMSFHLNIDSVSKSNWSVATFDAAVALGTF